jgi:hypothetical protein
VVGYETGILFLLAKNRRFFMKLVEKFKSLFKCNRTQVIKHFWKAELNDLYREKHQYLNQLRYIDSKINHAELMLFGN